MPKENRRKRKGTRPMKMPLNSLTALALAAMFLSGCCAGSGNFRQVQVSEEFLDGVIAEYPDIEQGYPYTSEIVKDWVAQNEP